MHERPLFSVLCDYKGRSFKNPNCLECFEEDNAETESQVKRYAAEEGWLIAGDKAFCPEHAKSKQAREAKESA